MIAYQTDLNGFYIGIVECQPSPLEPGEFLIPGGATLEEPPNVDEGQFLQLSDGEWIVLEESDILNEEEPVEDVELSFEEKYEAVRVSRLNQYRDIADPVFFSWQAGEVEKEIWLEVRESIKVNNPYPEAEEAE